MELWDAVQKVEEEIPEGYDIILDIEKGLKILIKYPDDETTVFRVGGDMTQGTLDALEYVKEYADAHPGI